MNRRDGAWEQSMGPEGCTEAAGTGHGSDRPQRSTALQIGVLPCSLGRWDAGYQRAAFSCTRVAFAAMRRLLRRLSGGSTERITFIMACWPPSRCQDLLEAIQLPRFSTELAEPLAVTRQPAVTLRWRCAKPQSPVAVFLKAEACYAAAWRSGQRGCRSSGR